MHLRRGIVKVRVSSWNVGELVSRPHLVGLASILVYERLLQSLVRNRFNAIVNLRTELIDYGLVYKVRKSPPVVMNAVESISVFRRSSRPIQQDLGNMDGSNQLAHFIDIGKAYLRSQLNCIGLGHFLQIFRVGI